jgi:hypothetical protein
MALIARYVPKSNEATKLNLVASPRRFMKAGNIEEELKKIREEVAWMRTEQKEMKRWIHVALRDPSSLSRY